MDLGYGDSDSATPQPPQTQSAFSPTNTIILNRPIRRNHRGSIQSDPEFSFPAISFPTTPTHQESSSINEASPESNSTRLPSSSSEAPAQRASTFTTSKPSSTTALVTTTSSITNARVAPPTETDPVGTTNVPSGPNSVRIMAVSFASLGVAALLAAMLVVMVCRRKRRRRRERTTEPVVFVTPVPNQAKTVSRAFLQDAVNVDPSSPIGTASEARDAAHLRSYAGGAPRGHRQETDRGLRLGMGPDVCRQQSVGTIRSENTTTSTSIETLPPPYARYD